VSDQMSREIHMLPGEREAPVSGRRRITSSPPGYAFVPPQPKMSNA
jgi:hypothetical protein